MTGLGIDQAHLVGLSMGGFACLHAALRNPVLSVVAAGTGYGGGARLLADTLWALSS